MNENEIRKYLAEAEADLIYQDIACLIKKRFPKPSPAAVSAVTVALTLLLKRTIEVYVAEEAEEMMECCIEFLRRKEEEDA